MKHFIRKEVISVSVDRSTNNFGLQQELSRLNEKTILPLLEKVFNELSVEDELLSFDKMEIELGNISRAALVNEILDQDIIEQIVEQVREQLKPQRNFVGTTREPLVNSRARIWMKFLTTGRLAWNITVMDTVFLGQVLESLAGDYIMVEQLRELISNNPVVAKRIVYRHDIEFIVSLMGILTADRQDDFKIYIKELARFFKWMKVQGHEWMGGKELFEDVKAYIFSRAIRIAAKEESGMVPAIIAQRILQPDLARFRATNNISETLLQTIPLLKPLIIEIISHQSPEVAAEKIETVRESQVPEFIGEEGIFVNLAGLVLLHPFLKQLFTTLKLINKDGFITHNTRLKAIYLLHFLATGEKEAPEEMLVIPKLLCDFPLNTPVKRKFSLTKKETTECSAMLQALIAQWSIIGNSSEEGLRESFLKRNGKVFHRNDNLYIQVEAKAYDMLLDHLPWNLGVIKLPWRKELIRVEWR